MKICFLANIDDNHCRKWVNYFAENKYETHVISPPSDYLDEIKGPNTAIYLLKNYRLKPLNAVLNAALVRKIIKDVNPDVLHSLYAGVSGMLGALANFHPFLITAFGSDILVNSKSVLLKPFLKFMLKKTDFISCNGQTLYEEMTKLGVKPSKIRFVYWGTDVKKFHPAPKNIKLLEKLKISADSPVIISLRNFEPVYDVETLVKTVPIIRKDFENVKFIIAGDGTLKDKIHRLAGTLGVGDCTKFVGWLPYDSLPDYLNSSDIYVSTSLSDGDLSQSTQQAMACGLPIITTKIAVNESRINDGENGIMFPPKDHLVLAEKIVMLLRNKDLKTKLGNTGRETIDKHLNYERNMERAKNLYEEAVKSKN